MNPNYGPRQSPSGLGPLDWSGVCPRCGRRHGETQLTTVTCVACGLRFSEMRHGGDVE